jgi:hypothetical protein
MRAYVRGALLGFLILATPAGLTFLVASAPAHAEGRRRERAPLPPPEGDSPNAVEGLSLPPDQTVDPDEGLITVGAKTAATKVRWLVVCARPVRSVEYDEKKAVVVSVPQPKPGEDVVIQVFAVALLKDELTGFARTTITVKAPRAPPAPKPEPTPDPGPKPTPTPAPGPPVAGKLHVTAILDYDAMTPAQAALVNSPTLRKALEAGGDFWRVYPATADAVKTLKFDQYVKAGGGVPALLVQQDRTGLVLTRNAKGERAAVPLPATEADLLSLVSRIHKGG